MVVAENGVALGVIRLKDVVKEGMRERFAELRRMGIRTIMITGDNPLTAAAPSPRRPASTTYLAEATPEDKMALIRREQAGGALVAMTGDGTNDAPALAQADVGVAMNTGTQAAREAGNMVDLDSNPTKLIEIVEIGKQLLITRGSLTTFSIANDVAKYFAIIPAMFAGAFPVLERLNVMHLATPRIGDPERGHLQRSRHRRPHPARAPRRPLPRRVGGERPAAQSADLRARRHHCSLCGHQDHRSHSLRCRDPVMRRQLPTAVAVFVFLSILTGLIYPLAVTGIAQVAFGGRADGSLIEKRGETVGSSLIGQSFDSPRYFHPRPSAAGDGYDAMASGASNLGPSNPALLDAVAQRRDEYRRQNGLTAGERVPVDAITGSGSGLDPHISPTNARLQARRVAESRGVPLARVLRLIDEATAGRSLGVFGDPGVNVLELNLALDERL